MNRKIYQKLAISNLRNNRRTYLPYILTFTLTVAMFYMVEALAETGTLGSERIGMLLSFTGALVGFFSVIFLFYTNSFLIKRRKKEIGVYQILGMEKRHIGRMLRRETTITGLISIGSGLILGILFGRLLYLILLKIMHIEGKFAFSVSGSAIRSTVILFGIIMLLTYFYNLGQVQRANPIELLHGSNEGEKEPRSNWLLTVIGILAITVGYYISQTTEDVFTAMGIFFFAAILVVIGTYTLFTSGSIVLLKFLKRRKSYYYQPKHFISVSGLLYRMKQNAVGLANICILSTMALVLISTSVSVYVGMNDILTIRFPHELTTTTLDLSYEDQMRDVAVNSGLEFFEYSYVQAYADVDGNSFELVDDFSMNSADMTIVSADEYNRIEGTEIVLGDGEVLVYRVKGNYDQDTIVIDGAAYRVKEELTQAKFEQKNQNKSIDHYYVVLSSHEMVQSVLDGSDLQRQGWQYSIIFDLEGSRSDLFETETAIREKINAVSDNIIVDGRELSRALFYEFYGSFLFIGVYLGIIFLVETVLLIYYKQISEGYDDRERYQIMQKVGMSKQEVKHTIQSQILKIFFLPLVVAVIHVAFAFKVVTKLLAFLNLTNITLFMICLCVVVVVFTLFYTTVYLLTARQYYQIVEA